VANAGLNRFPEQRVPQDVRALATLLMGLKCPSSQCVARFPLRHGAHIVNLYGRSIGTAFAHHFLPGPKGGLYAWEQVQQCSDVILVEGLFDYEVLWQVGFHNLTCSLGTHLDADSFDSFATDHALFISPSMSMPTRVANTRRCKGANGF
jgi:hypothetical protein